MTGWISRIVQCLFIILLHRYHKDYGQNLKEVRAIHLDGSSGQIAKWQVLRAYSRYYGDIKTHYKKRFEMFLLKESNEALQQSHYHYADEW